MNILTKRSVMVISTLVGSFVLAGTALAAGTTGEFGNRGGVNMPHPAVAGTVTSVSGDTLRSTRIIGNMLVRLPVAIRQR